jgi:hypothetical protein
MAQPLKSSPAFDVLEGEFWRDGWTSPRLTLEVGPEKSERVVRVTVTNPYFNGAYLRNRITVRVDGETAFEDLVFGGHGVRVEHTAAARAPLLVEIESEASLEPDELDERLRGLWLKLEQKAVAKPPAKA